MGKIKELTYYAVVLTGLLLKDCWFVDKGESLIKDKFQYNLV